MRKSSAVLPLRIRSLADEMDPIMEQKRREDRKRDIKEQELVEFYKRDELAAKYDKVKARLSGLSGFKGKLRRGEQKRLEQEEEALRLTLKNVDSRIAEERGALEARIRQERIKSGLEDSGQSPANDREDPQLERFKEQLKTRRTQSRQRGRRRGGPG